MDTRDLRCFRLVYEEGSINKAAGELFITPQGLSRIIRKLEYEFQAVLFERTSTGTIPTEYGDYLYTHSRELLYHMENIKQKMQQLNTKQNILHIGFACGTLNVLDFIPNENKLHGCIFFPKWVHEHPEITVCYQKVISPIITIRRQTPKLYTVYIPGIYIIIIFFLVISILYRFYSGFLLVNLYCR